MNIITQNKQGAQRCQRKVLSVFIYILTKFEFLSKFPSGIWQHICCSFYHIRDRRGPKVVFNGLKIIKIPYMWNESNIFFWKPKTWMNINCTSGPLSYIDSGEHLENVWILMSFLTFHDLFIIGTVHWTSNHIHVDDKITYSLGYFTRKEGIHLLVYVYSESSIQYYILTI